MGGLRFGFQMGVVPIYASLKRSSEVLDFYGKNLVRSSLTFVAEIRHRFALDDMDYDNHTERGEQVYIYIHHA